MKEGISIKTSQELHVSLNAIDHRGYPAYKDLKGEYAFPGYLLGIDHVQGDPFASPSRLSIRVSLKQASFPSDCFKTPERETAFLDHLLRLFEAAVKQYSFQAKGSGKSGALFTSHPGQEILRRTACVRTDKDLLVRFEAGFPANGRTINARELEKILFDYLPPCVLGSLYYKNIKHLPLENVLILADEQAAIRQFLLKHGFCAFVADGAILPRASGISNAPMKQAVPFASPENLRITIPLPSGKSISGMGIPQGVTLITGGGYHGKSTLLKALEAGVYNHIPGDGREYVITDSSALKLRAEDHRSIKQVDISGFIDHLPGGRNTASFSTEDASGSTSQAAGVIEGLEAGASVLLMDEDTCATNFMIRDELMQKVICREEEPITPFIERVRSMYEDLGISSVIVAGSSGAFFQIADTIIQMKEYVPYDITEKAKEAAKEYPALNLQTSFPVSENIRKPKANQALKKDPRLKMKTMGTNEMLLAKDSIELRYLEQLIDGEQTNALAYGLKYLELNRMNGAKSVPQLLDDLEHMIQTKGLASLFDREYVRSGLAMPRRQEMAACLNRYRKLYF